MTTPTVLATGLGMGESPRWHGDRLWYSDMGTHELVAVGTDGRREVVANVAGMPMGTGWLPDGRMLVVSSRDGRLLRREPDGSVAQHADLSGLSRYPWGDAVVDGRGNTYVGNIGFEFPGGEFAPGTLVLVTPDGTVRTVADGLAFPNGIAVTPDNATLIIAESYAARLTAFDIDSDGSLANRRVWAAVEGSAPDGICLDAQGAVWYADVPNQRCARVREGGEVLDTVAVDGGCFACALGGPQRRTLFLMVAPWPPAGGMGGGALGGRILTVEAPAPGVGWP
jgi:sugar lactone lactonase YvrE